MNKEMTKKLQYKLTLLNSNLQEKLDEAIKRKQKWEKWIEEDGNKPLGYGIEKTYVDMLQSDVDHIKFLTGQMEETNQLIKELEGM